MIHRNTMSKILALSVLVVSFSFSAFAHEGASGERRGKGPREPRLELTDEQKNCLEGILGVPGEGERPTHEQMDEALSSCGIEKPAKKSESVLSEGVQ